MRFPRRAGLPCTLGSRFDVSLWGEGERAKGLNGCAKLGSDWTETNHSVYLRMAIGLSMEESFY